VIKLLTIGQPRVGDETFVRSLHERCKYLREKGNLRVHRIITSGDFCPCYPPLAQGYHHFGKPICFMNEKEPASCTVEIGEKHSWKEEEEDEVMAKALGEEMTRKIKDDEVEIGHFDGGALHEIEFSADVKYSHATNTYWQCLRGVEEQMGGKRWQATSPVSRDRGKSAASRGPQLLHIQGPGRKKKSNA